MIPALIQCGDLRLSTKALGSKKASHVVVAKPRHGSKNTSHFLTTHPTRKAWGGSL